MSQNNMSPTSDLGAVSKARFLTCHVTVRGTHLSLSGEQSGGASTLESGSPGSPGFVCGKLRFLQVAARAPLTPPVLLAV